MRRFYAVLFGQRVPDREEAEPELFPARANLHD